MLTIQSSACFSLALSLLMICGVAGSGQAQQTPADIRANAPEDARLQTPVTAQYPHISIADMLERLSQQTGVPLRVNPRLKASGVFLMASLSHAPLKTVMDGLTSLAGCRSHVWRWAKSGQADKTVYTLYPADIDDMALQKKGAAQAAFEQQADFLIKAAAMSPEARKTAAGRTDANLLLADDKKITSGIKLLTEALSPEQRLQVLRGQSEITVPISRLSAEAQAFVQAEGVASTRPDLLTNQAKVFVVRDPGDISPVLYIDFGLGGSSYVGGTPLDNQLRGDVVSDWLLPGDAKADPLMLQVARKPKEPRPAEQQTAQTDSGAASGKQSFVNGALVTPSSCMPARLRDMAEAIPFSVMAIVPEDAYTASPYDKTVARFLQTLGEGEFHVMSKWRGGILLANTPAWFLHADSAVAADTTRRLQRAFAKPAVDLSLREIADATYGLTPAQIEKLTPDVPALAMFVEAIRPVFTLLHDCPQIETNARPAEITPEIRAVVKRLNFFSPDTLSRAVTIRLRKDLNPTRGRDASGKLMSEKDDPAWRDKLLSLELYDAADRRCGRISFPLLNAKGTVQQ